jgi:hypothetical protein
VSRICRLFFALLVLTPSATAQSVGTRKVNLNPAPYPLGNPVIRHMYTADAAPHVLPDGRVWMITSVDSDEGGGYETMHRYHAFSSLDLVNWTDHGTILHVDQVRPADAPAVDRYALWAPDFVYRDGKYYLYYPVRILHSDKTNPNGGRVTTSYLGVAVSDHPSRPFKVVVPKMAETKGIDPAVFIDDDGQPYLYWGSHMGARLAANMTELAEQPRRLEVDTDRFMEAAWMHKRDGKYFLSYHTKYDWQIKISAANADDPARKKSELAYSVGTSPLGPFTYGGLLNPELGVGVTEGPRHPTAPQYVPWRFTQSNHGGIVEFHGQDYLFYHSSALSSWKQDRFQAEGTWTQRSVCIDRIDYAADGSPIPVQQTVAGVPAVKISQPAEIKFTPAPAPLTAASQTLTFPGIDLGTGYYYFGATHNPEARGFRIEVRLDRADGPLLGTALPAHDPAAAGYRTETFLRGAKGRHTVVLVIHREAAAADAAPLALTDLRFFAGAPKPLLN